MERLSDGNGTKGLRVRQHLIMNMLSIEIFFECARDGHDIPPVVAGLPTEVDSWMD
jgi:hypothetical protein